MPTSLLIEILNYYPFGSKLCTIWIVLDVLCCTSSIHHMSAMALDRYLTIKFPLKFGRNKSKRIALIKISIVWFISICICSPLLILGFIDESNVFDTVSKQCTLFNKSFKLYGSIFAFYIPFTIMLIAYAKTIRILKLILDRKKNETNMQIRVKCVDNTNNSKLSENLLKNKSNKLSMSTSNIDYKESEHNFGELKSKSLINVGIIFKKEIIINKTKEKTNSLNISFRNLDYHFEFSSINNVNSILNLDKFHVFNSYIIDKIKPKSSSICIQSPNTLYSKDSYYNYDSSKLMTENVITENRKKTISFSSYQKIKNVANNERKALKVLIIMFTVFATLWSPFFILNTLSAIFDDYFKLVLSKYESVVYSLLTWLGYISSMANPIVYTMFNKAFRKAFLNIFLCNESFSKYSKDKRIKHKKTICDLKSSPKFNIYNQDQSS